MEIKKRRKKKLTDRQKDRNKWKKTERIRKELGECGHNDKCLLAKRETDTSKMKYDYRLSKYALEKTKSNKKLGELYCLELYKESIWGGFSFELSSKRLAERYDMDEDYILELIVENGGLLIHPEYVLFESRQEGRGFIEKLQHLEVIRRLKKC